MENALEENRAEEGACTGQGKIRILNRMTSCDRDRMKLRKVFSDAVKILGILEY